MTRMRSRVPALPPAQSRGGASGRRRSSSIDPELFTGDHLAWSETRGHLYAFRSACWYSWREQIESMKRLLDYRFEWVLPGHGRPVHLPADAMRTSLARCIDWMNARA